MHSRRVVLDHAALIHDAFDGRYQAGRQLGEGGFGQVFLATQVATGQQVAIKLLQLKQNKSIETQTARFQREMRLCAGLHHPNIVRLIDSGQLGADVLCTVFEYVPGETLADVLRKGGLDPREATHLMMQVLDALGCAHAAGIVHRDLKPQNIMVTSTGVRRNAMVLDFGIGAIIEAARLEEFSRLTKTNEMLGTPAYAAPEQLRGQSPSIRSDLYSWALVLLECLTGEQAIKADSLHELFARQSGPEPVPIPAWLRAHHIGRVLMRALVKQVDRRTVDAAELMRELERREVAGSNLEALATYRNQTPTTLERVDSNDAIGTLMESFDLERHVLAGERRQVTALCCTLVLSNGDNDLDLRSYLGLVQAQQRVWSDVLRAHDGYFAGSVGDRYLFYFGYPLAKEDDAVRAARCALAIVDATRERSAQLEAELGVHIEVAIGLHTDLVITQMMSSSMIYSDVVGLTPVIAERINRHVLGPQGHVLGPQGVLAGPQGHVLVSDATRRVLRDRFVYEPAGELHCGELAEPISLYRMLHERADTGEADQAYVGRTHELSLLEHRWKLAAEGEGQTVLVSAEAGVGKSRIVRELHRRLPASEHRFLVCRCAQESRNSALQPIIDLFEQLLGARIKGTGTGSGTGSSGVSDGQRANALDELLTELELTDDGGRSDDRSFELLAALLGIPLDPQRYPPLALTPDRKRELTTTAVIAVLLEMSERQPLLFLVEDVHWADPSTLSLFEQLFAEIPTSSTCVILTARPEFSVPSSLVFNAQVQLTPLADTEVAELLGKLTGGLELPTAVIRQITERADGIPLFVEELTQMLVGGRKPGLRAADVEVPATLRDALTARLDSLGPAKLTAHVASALGREFSFTLLEQVAVEFGDHDVKAHIEALHEAGLVTRKRRRGSTLYTFKHALVREVAHAAMLPEDRRKVHARTASVLEHNFSDIVDKRPELLAMHHRLAGQNREAIAYAQKAATLAILRSANVEAGAHAKEALEWLSELGNERERAEAELDLNGILTRFVMITQGYGTVDMEALLRRSEVLIADLGSSKHVFPNLAAFGAFHLVRGNMGLALQHAQRLVDLARVAQSPSQEVYGLSFLSQCAYFGGQYARQLEASKRAMELFDPVAHAGHMFEYGFDSRVNIDAHLSLCLTVTGEFDAALAAAQRVRERAQLLNIPHITYATLFALSCMCHVRQDRDALVRISDEVRALAAAQGGSWYVWLVETQRAWAEGRADAVKAHVALLRSLPASFCRGYWGVLAAELDADNGNFDSGLDVIDWALDNIDDGSRYILPEMQRIKARLLAGKSEDPADREAAISAIRDAIVTARADGAKLFELRSAIEYVRMTTKELDLGALAIDTLRAAYERFGEVQHPELVVARQMLASESQRQESQS
jgi:TOMM system kinase/cyclase fusion protein